MNITFRQLKLFLALSETGSVSAAARVMHVTQPTASMQLKEVTQAIGVPLYEVISKKIHLEILKNVLKILSALLLLTQLSVLGLFKFNSA
jgi:hypothetical protein